MGQTYHPKIKTDRNFVTIAGGPASRHAGSGAGAAAGDLAGEAISESVNPAVEDLYWRTNYLNRSYVERNRSYSDYQPAYRYGWESRVRIGKRLFREFEAELERGWDNARGRSKLAWTQAKYAAHDAWRRVGRA